MNFNGLLKTIAIGIFLFVIGVWVLMVSAPDVDAMVEPLSAYELDKRAGGLCSEGSIAKSAQWSTETALQEKQIRDSMIYNFEVKVNAKMVALLANFQLESLVMNCAIWKRLGNGT